MFAACQAFAMRHLQPRQMRAILKSCVPGRSAPARRAGVLPAAIERQRPMHDRPEKVFRIFIMASKPRGVLYVGMSSDLGGRAWKHREHVLEALPSGIGWIGWSISSVTTTRA